MPEPLPFAVVAANALAVALKLLRAWFPHGELQGHEYCIGSIAGEKGESLKINIITGRFADFANPAIKGGDLVELYALRFTGGDRLQALNELQTILGLHITGHEMSHEPPRGEWVPCVPPPVSRTPLPSRIASEWDKIYEYRDARARPLFYVVRKEARDGNPKEIRCFTYGTFKGRDDWHMKRLAPPYPLYGLDKLAAKPDAPVILCEGEKTADAAQELFINHVCISWLGGVNGREHTDLGPLAGRTVLIAPDNDPPGAEAAQYFASHLPGARILRVDDLPPKGDLADILPDDPDAWLAAHLPAIVIKTDSLGTWNAGHDDYIIRPRGWLLGNSFCRGKLSAVIAQGASGKTSLRLAQALSVATGRELTGEHVFQRGRVLFVSLEDDKDEIRRRLLAAMIHFGLHREELDGWFYVCTPTGQRWAILKDGQPVHGPLKREIEEQTETLRIDMIMLDPFIKSHSVNENDNNAIDSVCCMMVDTAQKYNVAFDVSHHTRKATMGGSDADSGRGATSMRDAARIVMALNAMTEKEAQSFDLPEHERARLFRYGQAKVNIAPPASKAKWFRMASVPLDNGNDIYPQGDEIQAATPWTPPETATNLDLNLTVLAMIEEGSPFGPWSPQTGPKPRSISQAMALHGITTPKAQAAMLYVLGAHHGVVTAEFYEEASKHYRTGLRTERGPAAQWRDDDKLPFDDTPKGK